MQYKLLCRPGNSLLEVQLAEGEKIAAEAGAMAYMSDTVQVETSARGGFFSGLKRSVLGSESFFQNTYTGPGELGLVPGSPGDIVAHQLTGGELFLTAGAYLASDVTLTCDSRWDGFKGFFANGLFGLRVTGSGMLFFGAYGHVQTIDVQGEYIVDNGYAVAWEPTLTYHITRSSKSVRAFLFSDQLVAHYTGYGKLWIQSHSAQAFASWLYPFRPSAS